LIDPNSPSFHDLLRSHLQIPSHLANRSDNSLHIAYEKYLAYIKAVPLLDELWTQRALPFTQKPSKTDIIESMQGKSYWYDYHRQAFPKVAQYPKMVAWLEGGEGAPSDEEVWGVVKEKYSFMDLFKFLNNSGHGLEVGEVEKERKGNKRDKKKGKGKGKEKSPDKRKSEGGSEKKKDKKKMK
jgi:hypothetical protein